MNINLVGDWSEGKTTVAKYFWHICGKGKSYKTIFLEEEIEDLL